MYVPLYPVFQKSRRSSHPIEIAIDASRLKIMGEGEWKVKNRGADKQRNRIKAHIGVDARNIIREALPKPCFLV